MSSAKTNLWTFWDGSKPAYIDLCQQALFRHCHKTFDIHVLDRAEAEVLVGPLKGETWNHRTDYLKPLLVQRFGGWWIDADMLVVRDFSAWNGYLKDHDFIGFPGFFTAREDSLLLAYWRAEMDKVANPTFSDLIQPLLTHDRYKEYEPITRSMATPIWHTGDELPRFFEDLPLTDYVRDDTRIVTLYNSAFSDQFKAMSASEILGKPWLISKMFKHALYESR